MSPLISVIIPIYNTENYLDNCLQSIITQENGDFEVILVNDGSTDKSESICNSYICKDKRFILLNKENGGVSSARNLGLKHAKGKFILFTDADDFISKDYLNIDEKFYNCDIIEKSAIHVNSDNSRILKYNKSKKSLIINDNKSILTYFVTNRTNALWNKFISRETIGDSIFDEELRVGEDFIFFTSLIHKVKSYGFSTTGNYYYRIHNLSIMQSTVNSKPQYIDNLYNLIPLIYSNSNSTLLAKGLIARYNIVQLFRKKKYLNDRQRDQLNKLFNQIGYKDLYYLSLKWKLKFIIKKYQYKLWRLRFL